MVQHGPRPVRANALPPGPLLLLSAAVDADFMGWSRVSRGKQRLEATHQREAGAGVYKRKGPTGWTTWTTR